jgi:hypothetical protein
MKEGDVGRIGLEAGLVNNKLRAIDGDRMAVYVRPEPGACESDRYRDCWESRGIAACHPVSAAADNGTRAMTRSTDPSPHIITESTWI